MDLQLAHIFDLDRPVSERNEEHLLKEAFVKSASAAGVDLSTFNDNAVVGLFGQYVGLYQLRKEQMAKEAQAVQMGRLLAHRMWKAAAGESFVDPDLVSEFTKHINPKTGVTLPPAIMSDLQKDPLKITQAMHATGHLDSATTEALLTHATGDAQAARRLVQTWGKDPGIAMRRAQYGAYAKGFTPGVRAAAPSAEEAFLKLKGLVAPAEEGLMARFGPSGIGKALSAGDWGQVARRGGPLALGALGLGWLWKRKNEADRERMMASAGVPMPGMAGVPVATA